MSKRDERFNSKTMAQNVGLKGLDSMDIFHEDADREKFVKALTSACEKYGILLLTYALMDNHVHMILLGDIKKFQHVFESLGATYARSFNVKYGRTGKFFDTRYYNGCINSAKQFLHTAAYIFNNPVEAGMADSPKSYCWSNFSEIRKRTANPEALQAIDELVNVSYLIAFTMMMAKRKTPSKLAQFLEMMTRKRVLDKDVRTAALEAMKSGDICRISKLEETERRKIVSKLWDMGANIAQIARVTGISRYSVEKSLITP